MKKNSGDLKNKELTVLAFDVSQERTGWALVRGMKALDWGNLIRPIGFKAVTFKDSEFTAWLCNYAAAIKEVINRCRDEGAVIDFVVMEDLNTMWNKLAKILFQFQAVAKLATYETLGIGVNLVHNKTVKSFYKIQDKKNLISKDIIDKAKKYKQKTVKIGMVDAVNKIHGTKFSYTENDEADAIGLATTFQFKLAQKKRLKDEL
jgi:Holliday junction resolvasome RuvABC endonuclease subunit